MARQLKQSRKSSIRDIPKSKKTSSDAADSKKPAKKKKLSRFFALLNKEFHPLKIPNKGETGKILNTEIRVKLIPGFVKKSFSEIGKVNWPNATETARLTLAVLIFATIFSIFIALLDFGLDKLFKEVIIN